MLTACAPSTTHVAPVAAATQTTAGDEPRQPQALRFVSPYTYEWFIRAELFRANGDLAAAADAYQRALAGGDEDPLVVARLALVLDALGQHGDARTWLAHGDQLDPRSEAVWLARGEIAERHNETASAIAAYERAEAFAPSSPHATWALARILKNSPERAHAVLRRFAERNDRWNPNRLHAELRIALDNADLDRSLAALDTLRSVTTPTVIEAEAVARLALEHNRPVVAREILDGPFDRIRDRALWLRVLIETRELERAELVIASSTPEELGGTANTAALYLAAGARERAAQLAAIALQQEPPSAALSVMLRANDLDALAAEVEANAGNVR